MSKVGRRDGLWCQDRVMDDISGLDVFAESSYRVQISRGRKWRKSKRLNVKARIDPETGTVTLYVDKDRLRNVEK